MDWFFTWFRGRMIRAGIRNEGVALVSNRPDVVSTGSHTQKAPLKRVELLNAVNGKVIEIMHRKSHQHDWETTLYIVKDDEALADAIATALLVTGEN
jgi:hypothetical protein